MTCPTTPLMVKLASDLDRPSSSFFDLTVVFLFRSSLCEARLSAVVRRNDLMRLWASSSCARYAMTQLKAGSVAAMCADGKMSAGQCSRHWAHSLSMTALFTRVAHARMAAAQTPMSATRNAMPKMSPVSKLAERLPRRPGARPIPARCSPARERSEVIV